MNQAIAIIIGATISACVTMIVVGLQHILETRRVTKEKSSDRLADFYTTAHKLALRIGDLARSPLEAKSPMRAQIRDELADRFNSLVSSIQLHDSHALIEIVYKIDNELVSLTDRAEGSVYSRQQWRAERANLSNLMDSFLIKSREELGVGQLGKDRSRRLPLPV